MNCLDCGHKACKSEAKDCNNKHDEIVKEYQIPENKSIYISSDSLVADGKAGKLSRIEEIVEYCHAENIEKVSLAYCYGMEAQATQIKEYLNFKSIKCYSARCTINGVKECEINPDFKNSVNCNPIGQAEAINEDNSTLVIEMGLCLGHDILFHKYLKKPFTVLVVKDRVFNNAPLGFFKDPVKDAMDNFDPKFAMKNAAWLKERIDTEHPITIFDLRGEEAFSKSHIPTSKNILLKNLTANYPDIIPHKEHTIICVCNGAIQSAYVTLFLRIKGYANTFNLAGGIGGWEKLSKTE